MNKPKMCTGVAFVGKENVNTLVFLNYLCTGGPVSAPASFQPWSRYFGWEEEYDPFNETLITVAYFTLPVVCKYIIAETHIRSCFQCLATFKVKSMIQKLSRCCDSSNC